MLILISRGHDVFGVPLKFERDIVPWFVTPRRIWAQHDQTNPNSTRMRERLNNQLVNPILLLVAVVGAFARLAL